jgi:hypothetical protein
MKHACSLCAAVLLLVPGCDQLAAMAQTKPEPEAVHLACAFEAVPLQTIYCDSFASDPQADGWKNWQPSYATNPDFATYDAESLRLSDTLRGLWQKIIPVPEEGGIYRFSASVKTDDAARNEFGIAVRPADANKKFSTMLNQFVAQNTGLAKSTGWTRREVFWVVPISGEINGEKLGGYDIEFLAGNLPGFAWCDDMTVEKVRVEPPYYTNFETGLDDWRVDFVRLGNESTGKVTHAAEGFADAGSVRVTLTTGVPGLAAARSLPHAAFAGSARWTLTAYGKAEGKAVPRLAVLQYDAEGKPVAEATGPNMEGEGWSTVALTFYVHEQAAKVRLLLMNAGPDTAQFDNVLLRPAYPVEEPPPSSLHPLRVGVYPADIIAAIDGSQPQITLPSGQTGAIGIFLSGQKREGATTLVEVELPTWLKLLAAEYVVWGKAPLQWETLPGRDDDHARYRFTDPYPWQELMIGDKPNYHTNLLLVFDADAAPGTDGEALIQTWLGDDAGEERRVTVRVRETIRPVERSDDFRGGLWGFLWPNLFDEAVREKLLTTYAAAGFNLGHYRQDRPFMAATFEKLGFIPYVSIIPTPDMRDGYIGTPLLTDETAMRLIDGKPYASHLAIGLALDDPVFRAAYKKRLADYFLKGFPERGGYAFLDLEYWGKGGTLSACFHPSTIESFRKWAKLSAEEMLTPQTILDKHGKVWAEFRLWAYVEVIRIARECLREIRPEIQVFNYAYVLDPGGKEPDYVHTSPMSTLRVDPYVDGHLIPTSNREGAAFIDALEMTIPYLKRPVWVIPFVMKELGLLTSDNYPYWQISAREYRFEIVAAAAYGAKGLNGYPGQLLDADYLLARRDGLADVDRYADFYFMGKRDDASVTLVEPPASIRRAVHVHGERRLLTLFNGSPEPAAVKWRAGGEEKTTEVEGRGYAQIEL